MHYKLGDQKGLHTKPFFTGHGICDIKLHVCVCGGGDTGAQIQSLTQVGWFSLPLSYNPTPQWILILQMREDLAFSLDHWPCRLLPHLWAEEPRSIATCCRSLGEERAEDTSLNYFSWVIKHPGTTWLSQTVEQWLSLSGSVSMPGLLTN